MISIKFVNKIKYFIVYKMHNSINNLLLIKEQLNKKNSKASIIAVSKTFTMKEISPLIDFGHYHFGENKIQEALEKWTDLKKKNDKIKLHMIGNLQSNKVKTAVKLFDYIHSVDSLKLAKKISEEQKKQNKKIKIFIQVNIGEEQQKNGIPPNEIKDFYKNCSSHLNLDIIGLMCLPPINSNTSKYFSDMKNLVKSLNLKELSMGMSSDYEIALDYGASFIRVGSKIFGRRSY